ncbi:hypothetical protein ACROYT_G012364 [Oculina patagonica]
MQCLIANAASTVKWHHLHTCIYVRESGKEQMSDVSTSESEGVASRMSLEPVKQVIHMTGNDNEGSKSVYGNDVEIITSEAAIPKSGTASNKIKFNSMANYVWELRYYRGCLIAVSSKSIAYALRAHTHAAC